MNIKEAWAFGQSQLPHSPAARTDARLLLEYILQVDHSHLISHAHDPLIPAQEEQYRTLIGRARLKEPIPYLTGHAPFFGLDLMVTPHVLIPRPETEWLVEEAISWSRSGNNLRVIDVGTGSGCIAICLAMHLPRAEIHAVDISTEALEIAQKNAVLHAPGRITFHLGNLLSTFDDPFDLIVANLPYVSDHEWTMLDDGVKLHEPAVALKGGDDGLDLIRQLLRQATSKLKTGGAIFLEIGWQQGPAARNLALTCFPSAQIELIPDYAGHDRIIAIKTG